MVWESVEPTLRKVAAESKAVVWSFLPQAFDPFLVDQPDEQRRAETPAQGVPLDVD